MKGSSLATGGVTVSAATLVPLVSWALNGFQLPIPETVPYLIAASIVTLAHAIYNVVTPRLAAQPKKEDNP